MPKRPPAKNPFQPKARAPKPRATTSPETTALAPSVPSLRAQQLHQERERLLREIKRRRRELERAMQRMAETLNAARERLAPIWAKHHSVEREVHALFEEILTTKKWSSSERAKVRRLYGALQAQGLVDPPPRRDEPTPEEPVVEEAPPSAHDAAPREEAGFSLRALFRRLARLLHPDLARHEDERAYRTEVMKEATRAYEMGDLARLLELEQRWASEREAPKAPKSAPDLEESLSRTVAELKAQLKATLAELRALRRSGSFRTAQHLRRAASVGVDLAEVYVAAAERDLNRLSDVRSCLHAFVAGRLRLIELLSEPCFSAEPDDEPSPLDD